MRYQPPSNSTPTPIDPEPHYVDGQPGIKGSIPPARAIEDPQREILNAILGAGLTPSDDLTQLWQAIQAAAAAAAGGGGGGGSGALPSDWAQMPIYPEIKTGGGFMSVSAVTGQVTVDGGQIFVWRGGVSVNTNDVAVGFRQFSTVANKTYHLRWRWNGGSPVYQLLDLADTAYNPSAAAETNPAFDTSHDDMLIARVVTSSVNTPTVTPLMNKHVLKHNWSRDYLAYPIGGLGVPAVMSVIEEEISYNFARTPVFQPCGIEESELNVVTNSVTDGSETNLNGRNITRNSMKVYAFSWSHVHGRGGRPRYNARAIAD